MVGLDNSGKTSLLNCLVGASSGTSAGLGSRDHSPTFVVDSSSEPSTTVEGGPDRLSAQEYLAETQEESGNNSGLLAQQDPLTGGSRHDSIKQDKCCQMNDGNIMPTVGYNYERVRYKNLTMTVLDFSGQNKYRGLWQEFYNCIDGIVFVIDSSDLIRLVVVRDELENLLSHPYFSSLPRNNTSALRNNNGINDSLHLQANFYNNKNNNSLDQQPANNGLQNAHLIQKQLTISQNRLIQTPLETANNHQAPSTKTRRPRSESTEQPTSASGLASGRRTKIPILFLANKADLPNSVSTDVIIKALNLQQLRSDRHPWFIQATSVNCGQGVGEAFDWLITELLAKHERKETR